MSERDDAAALVIAAAALVHSAPRPTHQDQGIGRLARTASALGRVGERAAGLAMLEDACRALPTVTNEFWAKHARSDIAEAAEDLSARDELTAHGISPYVRAVSKPTPSRSAKTLLDLAAKEIAELPTNHGNWHGTFGTLVGLAKELHDRGDHASLAKLTARADVAAQSLDLRKGWIPACVLSDLAVLHGWAGETGRSEELLVAAETAAAKERNASHRKTATLSLREAFDQLAQPDRPITLFAAERDLEREVATLVRRDDLRAVERLIAAEPDAETKAGMLRHVATCLVAARP